MLNQYLEKWEQKYGTERQNRSPEERFAYVIERAYESTGKQAVVLVDEYDKPLLQTLSDEVLMDEYRRTLKAFYGVLKSSDRYLRFVFLTGVTKFAQVSVFSDLNQLRYNERRTGEDVHSGNTRFGCLFRNRFCCRLF